MQAILVITMLISAFAMKLSPLIGIGVFLYQWGALSTTISLAAWLGFKLFLVILLSGFLLFFISMLGVVAYDGPNSTNLRF